VVSTYFGVPAGPVHDPVAQSTAVPGLIPTGANQAAATEKPWTLHLHLHPSCRPPPATVFGSAEGEGDEEGDVYDDRTRTRLRFGCDTIRDEDQSSTVRTFDWGELMSIKAI
jgi:hypothetical protein